MTKQYDQENLIIHPVQSNGSLIAEVTPQAAGWDTIHFQVHHLAPGQQFTFDSRAAELALVVLSGKVNVTANCGVWEDLGGRSSVFTGLPSALYLPIDTTFTVSAAVECEFAIAWVLAEKAYPPQRIDPHDIEVEIRGGDNATRQINKIIPPGFACDRLVVVEVYTPSGNWSSYPPHKHDVLVHNPQGELLEADLDEIYFYKIDRPEGYAFQRVYTDASSPLEQAGCPIDATLLVRSNDTVLVPEGYHPVVVPPGYTAYYLNVLAGSHQSLAAIDDPQYTWVKETYQSQDPRVPLYPLEQK
jgi:5-deoxy-glucuronate isomerase